MKVLQKTLYFFVFILLLFFIISCATPTMGTIKLNSDNVDRVIEGKTAKQEIVNIFGHPNQMFKFDEKGLQEHLYGLTLKKEENIPKGQYEVWFYYHFSSKVIPFIPIPSVDIERKCSFVINDKDIVTKKIYQEKSKKGI